MINGLKQILFWDQIDSYGGLSEPSDNINFRNHFSALLVPCFGNAPA
jgi:hypothetical protein